jgi:hypothetical protein
VQPLTCGGHDPSPARSAVMVASTTLAEHSGQKWWACEEAPRQHVRIPPFHLPRRPPPTSPHLSTPDARMVERDHAAIVRTRHGFHRHVLRLHVGRRFYARDSTSPASCDLEPRHKLLEPGSPVSRTNPGL